jgi:molybdenum cofactor cytidylyltransferase
VVSAAVLAAGLSTRIGGESKALLRFDDRDSFVTRIVRTFNEAGIDDVVVIVGHQAAAVTRQVDESRLQARCVVNGRYHEGQTSSLMTAIDAVDRPGVEGLLLALVDAPAFRSSTVRALVARFRETQAPVVRAVREGQHGHPVLIGRALFDPLRNADTATGAKPIVRAHASDLGDVPVSDVGAFLDVDTPDDYAVLAAHVTRMGTR